MSQENVEIVRRIYDRWAGGEFRAGRELLIPTSRPHGRTTSPRPVPTTGQIDTQPRCARG